LDSNSFISPGSETGASVRNLPSFYGSSPSSSTFGDSSVSYDEPPPPPPPETDSVPEPETNDFSDEFAPPPPPGYD